MVSTFYNDTDTKACAWLEQLAANQLVSAGRIDSRSITELGHDDVAGYERVHLFAGIGGWDYALRLAGWTGPVWTGSCPCQPFSSAGKRKGAGDERHLWPEMFRLIRECRPGVVFGEQVCSAGVVGKAGAKADANAPVWLDGVFADLEREGYACGAVVLGAHSVGAPHIRQRLYWVADAQGIASRRQESQDRLREAGARWSDGVSQAGGCCDLHGQRTRRTPPGVPLLADGLSEDVDYCVSFGNAIVPQVAAEFVRAYMEVRR